MTARFLERKFGTARRVSIDRTEPSIPDSSTLAEFTGLILPSKPDSFRLAADHPGVKPSGA